MHSLGVGDECTRVAMLQSLVLNGGGMDLAKLEVEMKDQLNADQVELALDGNRLSVLAVASCFSDLNRVKRQQKVYAFLNAFIADGTLHAVSIKALSPEELS
jgi:acid stress-induced BolA-like protein IbaG/YrbA